MDKPIVEIEGHNDLVREMNSKALLNTDRRALERYKQQSAKMQAAKKATEEVQNLKDQISVLSNEMNEIKNLLLKTLGR